jgi:hypothetical protein
LSDAAADARLGIVRFVIACALALAAGCIRDDTQPLPPFDPAATCVAHAGHGGLAIDRMPGAAMGRFEGRSFGEFVAYADHVPIAVLRTTSLATVAGRDLAVTPSWTPDGIRLAIASSAGTLSTGQFIRADGRPGMPTLARTAQTNLDVRGTFRAELSDAGGAPRGWFAVRVPGPDEPRLFFGDLPGASPAAGPAMALALVSELDWIDDHTIDVYRGSGRDRGGGHGQGR